MNDDLKTIISDKDCEKVAKKILDKTVENFTKELNDHFYDETREYLYEHHANFQDRIFNEVFIFICGKGYTQYKDRYDATLLRANIYKENKEDFDKMITDQIMKENVHKYFELYFANDHKTNWEYKDLEKTIINWLFNNYETSIFNEKMPEKFKTEIGNLKKRIEYLNEKLQKIEDAL